MVFILTFFIQNIQRFLQILSGTFGEILTGFLLTLATKPGNFFQRFHLETLPNILNKANNNLSDVLTWTSIH